MCALQEMPISGTYVPRWVLKGGISISRCPALRLAAQYVRFLRERDWKPLPDCGTGFFRLAHCWVLRQQDRMNDNSLPALSPFAGWGLAGGWKDTDSVLFLIVPAQV